MPGKARVELKFYVIGRDISISAGPLLKFLSDLHHFKAEKAVMDVVKNYQNHLDGFGVDEDSNIREVEI